MLRESLVEPARYEGFGTVWAVIPAGEESIFAGVSRTLPVSAPLTRVTGGSSSADMSELAYGWPLVVCRDSAGAVRCAPLLIASVVAPGAGARSLTVDVDSAQLNIAVADPRFQPDGDPTLLRVIGLAVATEQERTIRCAELARVDRGE